MKNHLLKITSFVMLCHGMLSAQDILWEHSYWGKHAEFLRDAQPTADCGFILAGASLSYPGCYTLAVNSCTKPANRQYHGYIVRIKTG